MKRYLRRLLIGMLALAAAGCTVTGSPDGGTPYGLEERSHGKP